MKVNIVFKDGFILPVICEEFTLERNIYDDLTGFKFKGIKSNKPLYICFDSVLCVYREEIKEEL